MPHYTCDFRNPYVYDKAKYHHDANDFPESYPIEQAYVHTGLFVAWLAENDLLDISDPVNRNLIAQCKRREITGPQQYEKMGECLIDYMLTEEGNLFAQEYFNFSTGAFIPDYRALLVKDLPSDYAVSDSWENYEIIRQRFDERFRDWKAKQG